MSKLTEIDPPYLEDTEEIDELNDETFGCDLTDDWEEAHEKLAGVDDEPGVHFALSQSSKSPPQQNDYAHPDCEDIVKSSISNCFFEDNLSDDDFNNYDNEPQNVITKPKTKVKKSINLDSLRPPSPSILPFDDQFMSSVWRPLSPELNHQQQQQQQKHEPQLNDSGINQIPQASFIQSLPKQMKVLTLEEIEREINEKHHREHQQQQQALHEQHQKQQQQNQLHGPGPIAEIPHVGGLVPQALPKPMKMGMTVEELEKSLHSTQPPQGQPPPPPVQPQLHHHPQLHHPQLHHPQLHHPQLQLQHPQHDRFTPVRPQLIHPLVLHPMVQQEQQRLINTIITPAQAQRGHRSHLFNNFRPMHDKFAGFMSQREKDWLIKIFRLQCKVSNPYVEDYYEVNFNVKKATNERRKTLAKQQNKDANDEEIDEIIENDPMIVLPEHAKMEEEQPKYIQFDNTLGKIQMLNTKCPRKLLDVNPDKPNGDSSNSNSFYAILAKIEVLYEHLLNIEDEDKRMPILPENIKALRLELRVQLCQHLFEGIVKPIPSAEKGGGTMFALINRTVPTLKKLENEVDPEILSVSKGALLVYRSLLLLRKEDHFVVLLCSLVKSQNCKQLIIEAEENPQLNIGNMLVKALGRIKEARNLIYITAAIDDIELIVLSKFGHRFLVTIFKQYNNADDKLLFIYFWKLFVQALVEKVSPYMELHSLCIEHLSQLNEL